MTYFDSSALIKRYLKEEGSGSVGCIMAGASVIATSKLAYPEILSAFMRKYRRKEIGRESLDVVTGQFESDWERYFIVQFHDGLMKTVRVLIEKHPLRGADAVHLSSALWLQQATKAKLTFVASDLALLNAAQAEKLEVVNPQHE